MTIHCLDLSEALVAQSHDVYLLVGDTNIADSKLKYLYKRIERSKIKLVSFQNREEGSVLNILSSLFKICYKILAINPDIIHSQSPHLSFVPWLLRKKFVSTIHVNDLERRFEYKNATTAIAISQETYQDAVDKFNYKPNQLALVFHGVSARFAQPSSTQKKLELKNELKISAKNIVIGIVASIEKRKGQDVLINALEKLSEEEKINLSFIILGSYKNGKSSGWLEQLIEKSSLKEKIIWKQYQDPKLFYDIIDILVFPSSLEGFGLVVVEAMLSNCAVIRSNTQGASDQIIDGETGFIFENRSVEGLTDKFKLLLNNADIRKRVAAKGKEIALQKFTAEVMARNTIKVYEKLLK